MNDPADIARVDQLAAEARDALKDVRDHYATEAAGLRAQIERGEIDRSDAITHLCTRHRLTEVGAADILDRED